MHLELTGFRLLFCLAAVIHNITPADMNVRGCVVVVIHNVVGDGVGCRTFGPAPGPILLYKGNKGQRGNIRAGHNDLVRVGGPDRLVEGGQLLPDGGRQRHGGSQAALLAESPLEMHPGPPVWEVKLDRQRAKGVVAGIRAVSIVYEFLGPLAKKFHVVDTAESVLDHPHRLISISRRFFSVGDRESLDGGGEGNGHGIFVSDLVWAQVRVEEDRLLVGTLQRGPEGPTCVHRFRKRSGRGGRGFRPVAARKEGSPMGRTAFSRVASISLKRPVQASARTLTLGSQSSETAMAAICAAILELSIKSDFTLSKSIEGGGGSVSGG